MIRNKSKLTLYDCDRCKFTYKKHKLKRQRGMLLCDPCFDSSLEIAPVNLKLRSSRSNSTTTTAVNNPTTFTIGTAGVTALNKSQVGTREGVHNTFVMYVVGNPTVITANPQIVAGRQGYLMTLIGTSDTNSVTIASGNGTDLSSSMVLKRGCSINLVYNATSSLWCETSRSLGGVI